MCDTQGRARNCHFGMPSRSSSAAHTAGVMYSALSAWLALRSIGPDSSSGGAAANHGSASARTAFAYSSTLVRGTSRATLSAPSLDAPAPNAASATLTSRHSARSTSSGDRRSTQFTAQSIVRAQCQTVKPTRLEPANGRNLHSSSVMSSSTSVKRLNDPLSWSCKSALTSTDEPPFKLARSYLGTGSTIATDLPSDEHQIPVQVGSRGPPDNVSRPHLAHGALRRADQCP